MQTYSLLIATPETTLFEDEVLAAILPGEEGFFEILPNHASFIGIVKAGFVEVVDHKKEKHQIKISGGFFEVTENRATILCDPSKV